MARLLDRLQAERLLGENLEHCQDCTAKKAAWDAALIERGKSWLEANEAGLQANEIADHCGCSVGLVKLEISKAKKAREEAARRPARRKGGS